MEIQGRTDGSLYIHLEIEQVCLYVCVCTYLYADIFYFHALREPENSDTPIPRNRPDIEILVSKYYSLRLEQGKFKMSLGYVIVSENNEILKE